jgi:hypothetical protein
MTIPEAVIAVVQAPDDGCQHTKHVELPREIEGGPKLGTQYIIYIFVLPLPPNVLMNFRGFPPGCGDSVADF